MTEEAERGRLGERGVVDAPAARAVPRHPPSVLGAVRVAQADQIALAVDHGGLRQLLGHVGVGPDPLVQPLRPVAVVQLVVGLHPGAHVQLHAHAQALADGARDGGLEF